MSVIESTDTTANTPKTRRAVLAAAVGGVIASVVAAVRAPAVVRAVDPNDIVLDGTNNAAGTTEILSAASDPTLRVTGGTGTGIRGEATTGRAIDAVSVDGYAMHALSKTSVGIRGASGSVPADTLPDPIAASTGVYGLSVAGHGVYGASDTGVGVYAANNSSTVAAIVAEGGPGTAIHGHANAGPVPASPALTGIYGSAAGTGIAIAALSAAGVAIKADSASGNAVVANSSTSATALVATAFNGHGIRGTSVGSHGIRGHGALDGVIGESAGGRSGVVGYSGSGSPAPAGPAKVGVYGEATQDTASRGVSGYSLTGQGVRGEASTGYGVRGEAIGGHGVSGVDTTGIGVQAIATTGIALDVLGRARFSRSGQASIGINKSYVDVTVPGPLPTTALAFAMLKVARSGAWVSAVRVNYPTAGKIRIYCNKVAHPTISTPVAWIVFG